MTDEHEPLSEADFKNAINWLRTAIAETKDVGTVKPRADHHLDKMLGHIAALESKLATVMKLANLQPRDYGDISGDQCPICGMEHECSSHKGGSLVMPLDSVNNLFGQIRDLQSKLAEKETAYDGACEQINLQIKRAEAAEQRARDAEKRYPVSVGVHEYLTSVVDESPHCVAKAFAEDWLIDNTPPEDK